MAAPVRATQLKPVFVQNRKYIGSKYHLLAFIAGVVADRAPGARSMGDLFCGSGVVAAHFAARGMAVTAVDNLYHNWVATRCFIATRRGQVRWVKMTRLLEELNELPPVQGYCSQEFGGTYFTVENASRIDAVREAIASWKAAGEVTEQEHAVLLTSLLYATDKVANTCGQYDAFLKHLGSDPYSAEGVHRVDAMVYRPLQLGVPQIVENGRGRALCGDADGLVSELAVDVLYLDPPYNTRQYVDNYHVLENIARWEKPVLHGKTRKFERDHLKSGYSTRRCAATSLERLISRARAKHILLSYNNEGIVPDEAIVGALSRRGPVEIFTRSYAIFGNGAGRSVRRPIEERLFYCQVKTSPQG
ncbi:MAG TPA: DNA adenine methylase [Symbiobacteriaceae bacterium]|nr:DNA adenine methylase [Symbiobacteriaceae bacterium]